MPKISNLKYILLQHNLMSHIPIRTTFFCLGKINIIKVLYLFKSLGTFTPPTHSFYSQFKYNLTVLKSSMDPFRHHFKLITSINIILRVLKHISSLLWSLYEPVQSCIIIFKHIPHYYNYTMKSWSAHINMRTGDLGVHGADTGKFSNLMGNN